MNLHLLFVIINDYVLVYLLYTLRCTFSKIISGLEKKKENARKV